MLKMRLVLFELYKNSMFKKGIITIILLLSFSFYGQNVNNSTSSTAIKANFSMISIKAYQESAVLKIEDYYNYLGLLSSTSTSDSLKEEIKSALFSLLKDSNIKVLDFTSEEKNPISLIELIEKIKNKNYSFLILNLSNTFLSTDSWTTGYNLEVLQKEKKQIFKCSQKVYFTQTTKRFGPTEKEVWTIKLGEID